MRYKLINKIPGCDFEVTIKWGKNTTLSESNRKIVRRDKIDTTNIQILSNKILYLFAKQNPVVPLSWMVIICVNPLLINHFHF